MRRRALPILVLGIAACGEVEPVVEDLFAPPSTPREGYVRTLERAGLAETALMRDWQASGASALESAPVVPVLFREAVAVEPGGNAQSWRVPVRRGQRVRVTVDDGPDDTPVFLDAFALVDGSLREAGHAEAGRRELSIEPAGDGVVLIRAQPGLLAVGRFTLSIRVEPTLGFPVADRSVADVGSVFGDPRDGGVRDHHGIDIFAPRGTPVVAVTEGTVSRVRTTARGGKVVWVRDARRRQSLYYAHLDSQLVADGTYVRPGDTLGLVGNTGNARTTPPHLHFGIYSRGPVDPVPFVRPVRGRIPELSGDTALVGEWIRTAAGETTLRSAPAPSADEVRTLPRSTAMHVVGAVAGWLRVRLPDGSGGYVSARSAEQAESPLGAAVLDDAAMLLARPYESAPPVVRLDRGERVAVHGRFGPFLLVRTDEGALGWVADPQAG